MAAAALGEIWTARLNPLGRWRQHTFQARAGKAFRALRQRGLDLFASNDERHEHGFAAAALVGLKPGQSVATIHEFFDDELRSWFPDGGGVASAPSSRSRK